jgi:arabinan endo-1,5-alpha-L-arabinosidase
MAGKGEGEIRMPNTETRNKAEIRMPKRPFSGALAMLNIGVFFGKWWQVLPMRKARPSLDREALDAAIRSSVFGIPSVFGIRTSAFQARFRSNCRSSTNLIHGLALIVGLAMALSCLGAPPPRIHDPSPMVKCGDAYWLFSTGPGVLSWHSRDRTNWNRGPRVFAEPPAWADKMVPGNRGYFWAPDVIQESGRYFLYYSVSTFGKNTSVIALATNATLDPNDPRFRWVDQGPVVASSTNNNFNAIDPSVMCDQDGTLWMAFGSFWSGIQLVQLDPGSGKRLKPEVPMISLAYNASIEAPCLYRHGDFYYLWVNWGECCKGTNSTYDLRIGRSKTVTGPYLDQTGRSLADGGGTPFLKTQGSVIGPGHAGVVTVQGADWLSFHYYDGTRRGMPTLGLRRLEWGTNGWPAVN